MFAASASLWACSSDDDNGGNPGGGEGGVEGGDLDGTVPGEGGPGADGGDAAPPTQKEACDAYLIASCQRRFECTGQPVASCVSLTAFCPDYLFSPGSTRTIESVMECTQVRRTQSCDEVIEGVDPPCASPGTRKAGEQCSFVGQCESMSCSAPTAACGTCRALKAPGTGCPDFDETCGQNKECTSEDAGCVARVVDPKLAPGAACSVDAGPDAARCPGDAPCSATTAQAQTGTCTPPPSTGPCLFRVGQATASLCAYGTTCLRIDPGLPNGDCVAPGVKDQPCGQGYNNRTCAEGFFCTDPQTKGTCQPLHKQNESCSLSTQCEPALYCDRSASPALGTCVPRAAVGASCGNQVNDAGFPFAVACGVGLECTYVNLDGGAGDQLCTQNGGIGAPCGQQFQECRSPLTCNAGVCGLPSCVDAGPG